VVSGLKKFRHEFEAKIPKNRSSVMIPSLTAAVA
jgi:hypothetical protein